MGNPIDGFRQAMQQAGINYSGPFTPDGNIHRFNADNETGKSGWYSIHERPKFLAGIYGCWRRGIKEAWNSARNGAPLSDEDKREMAACIAESREKHRTEEEKIRHEARLLAQKTLNEGTLLTTPDHAYLQKKKVKVHGHLRIVRKDLLTLPLCDINGHLHSLQFIAPEKRWDGRDKTFLTGGRTRGCFFLIGDNFSIIVICEGYATGASIHEATGWTTVCAMDAGNLLHVAKEFRSKYPTATIIIAADNDRFDKKTRTANPPEKNTGIIAATAAAKNVKAHLAIPEFADEDTVSTDFNDLAALGGLEYVKRILTEAIPITATPIGNLTRPTDNDPSELLKTRFLCRKQSLLFIGPTGKGKSSFLLQALALWANSKPCFGIEPVRPLKSIYVQAENDDGDIAAIRDGICQGLDFTPAQQANFYANVLVFTETNRTGKPFCDLVLRKLLEFHRGTDILAIDPALSYLGGDTKEQRDVSAFLRNYLNPVIFEHDCACILNHHTNKLNFADDPDAVRDFAYYGSGSAEWANWARAILALEPTKNKGVFKLHAAKRGQKIGWKDAQDQLSFSKLIAHSKDQNIIYWRDASTEECSQTNPGRPKSIDNVAFLAPLNEKPLSSTEWKKLLEDEHGVTRSTFFDTKKRLEKEGLIAQDPMNKKWRPIAAKGTYGKIE